MWPQVLAQPSAPGGWDQYWTKAFGLAVQGMEVEGGSPLALSPGCTVKSPGEL